MIAVQKEYQVHKLHEGIVDTWIWREHIEPKFYIGIKSFYRYLTIPAKREFDLVEDAIQKLTPPCEPLE